MKLIIALLLTGFATAVPAQKAEDFRIFDGKLYNNRRSTNWIEIAYPARLADDKKATNLATLTVLSIEKGEAHCTRSVVRRTKANQQTEIAHESIRVRHVLVAFPGMVITTCRAMKLTPTIYDCVTPNRKQKPAPTPSQAYGH